MRRRAAAVAAIAVAAAGCGDGLRFTRDARLEFLSPGERELTRTPVAVRWRMQRPRGGVFAVFIDRPPIAPGQPVQAVAEDDPFCRPEVGCPDATWLADHGVRLTRRSGILLDALPAGGGRRFGDRRRHEVTVVLLDANGVRREESAWRRSFFVREPRR